MILFAYRSGKLEVGRKVVEGTIGVGRGNRRTLVKAMERRARLAYDNGTWLVPGVPEADNETEALEALKQFTRSIKPLLKEEVAA